MKHLLGLASLLAAGCADAPPPSSKPAPAPVATEQPKPIQKVAERPIVALAVRLREAGVGQTIKPGDSDDVMHLDNLTILEFKSPDAARVAATELDPRLAFAHKQFVLAATTGLDRLPPIGSSGTEQTLAAIDSALAILRRARAALTDR